jgi:integrase
MRTEGTYRRSGRGTYYVDVRWKGYPRIQLSTRTHSKRRARAMLSTLQNLRDMGRRDLLGLIADHKVGLSEVHDLMLRDPTALDQRIAEAASRPLAPVVAEWLAWLGAPGALAPRTRRAYAPQTIRRYATSWDALFAALPKGRASTLTDLTKGFVADFRGQRVTAGASGATVNRDVVALQSFWRWLADEREIQLDRFPIRKEREAEGRERWLTSEEIALLRSALRPAWWPLFAILLHTGMRIGEAQGLRWGDVRFREAYIDIHDAYRRLKNTASARQVPITEELSGVLTEHARGTQSGHDDFVFTSPLGSYDHAYRELKRAIKQVGLPDATIHDLRHTFGVHAAQAGVPLARIQKLMGHASAVTTMKYMKHAPDKYFAEDAALVAASLSRRPVGLDLKVVALNHRESA